MAEAKSLNWPGWRNMLPAIRAENAEWRRIHLPRLKAYDAAQQKARDEAAARQAEMEAALAWCQANGNPHKAWQCPPASSCWPLWSCLLLVL